MCPICSNYADGPNSTPIPDHERPRNRRGRPGFRPSHPLRILILGGTGFLGPHLVRFALHRGHHVTVFNRGQTEPTMFTNLFSQVEKLVGDRADDLSSLAAGEWDAVIDNSGRNADWTAASAQLLKGLQRLFQKLHGNSMSDGRPHRPRSGRRHGRVPGPPIPSRRARCRGRRRRRVRPAIDIRAIARRGPSPGGRSHAPGGRCRRPH